MYEYLHIGEIVNTHGVRGEVKIIPLTDDIRRFDDLANVYIEENDTNRKEYEIESVRYHKQFVIMKFKGIDDMDTAMKLKTKFLAVHRKDAVKLPEDTYFICDLIGLTIIDDDLGEVGKIEEVIKTGSNDVYVTTYKNKPLCIPVLTDVVNHIDIENGIVEVKIPKGLL